MRYEPGDASGEDDGRGSLLDERLLASLGDLRALVLICPHLVEFWAYLRSVSYDDAMIVEWFLLLDIFFVALPHEIHEIHERPMRDP